MGLNRSVSDQLHLANASQKRSPNAHFRPSDTAGFKQFRRHLALLKCAYYRPNIPAGFVELYLQRCIAANQSVDSHAGHPYDCRFDITTTKVEVVMMFSLICEALLTE